jgi:ATP-dependent exoDNAse (exonuclease V) alpha subunit
VISGYPGTGKTTLISAFVHLFDKMNLNYSLMSPTGIAAKNLSKVTGKPACTIHRALGCDKEGEWEFNYSNKYVTDVQQATMQLQDQRLNKVQLLKSAWQKQIDAESLALGIELSMVSSSDALNQINQTLWKDTNNLPAVVGAE